MPLQRPLPLCGRMLVSLQSRICTIRGSIIVSCMCGVREMSCTRLRRGELWQVLPAQAVLPHLHALEGAGLCKVGG